MMRSLPLHRTFLEHRGCLGVSLSTLVALLVAGCGNGTYTQHEQDRDTLHGFNTYFGDDWNAKIAYKSVTGTVDYTNTSSNGGTAHVTGTIETDLVTYAFVYVFKEFAFSVKSNYCLDVNSLTGEINVNGVLNDWRTFTADTLDIEGTVSNTAEDARADIDNPLSLDATTTPTTGSGTVNARTADRWSIDDGSRSSSNSSCDSVSIDCGTVRNGIETTGGVVPTSCGACPDGTYIDGTDNVTEGGPYYICTCDGY